nr:hypothetical transcript [Hymenolepis microstoma]
MVGVGAIRIPRERGLIYLDLESDCLVKPSWDIIYSFVRYTECDFNAFFLKAEIQRISDNFEILRNHI